MNKTTIKNMTNWIKNYITKAHAKGVIIGMSGGKDSLIVAKLCILALGEENVFGVIMPNGKMKDKSDAITTCKLLNMPYTILDISKSYNNILKDTKKTLNKLDTTLTDITTINLAPRIRMTTLYSIAGSLNYLVANTSNLSEISVGYSTKWGDSVGDFAPLAQLTKTEVCKLGMALGLPDSLVNKEPDDGLSGKTDEDKLGFSYKELDTFIRTGKKGKNNELIMKKHNISHHKRKQVESFDINLTNHFNN